MNLISCKKMEVNCNFCPFWSASLLKGGYRVGFVVKPASLLKAWVSCRFFILIGCQLFLEFVLFNSFTVVVEDKAIVFAYIIKQFLFFDILLAALFCCQGRDRSV